MRQINRNQRRWRPPLGLVFGGLLVLGALAQVGCAKEYVRVDVESERLRDGVSEADISATNTYHRQRDKIKTLTFRLPENCQTETAAVASGRSSSSDVMMATRCSILMSELERALVDSGYQVVSWDNIQRQVETRDISPYRAAKLKNVDAVILVNSLEASAMAAGGAESSTLSYYASNPDGERLDEIKLSTATRKRLRSLIGKRFSFTDDRDNDMFTVTLDLTVVLVRSGESVWFYRRSVGESLLNKWQQHFLFRGREQYFRPVLPRYLVEDVDLDEYRAEEFHTREYDGTEELYRAKRQRLVRDVVHDFVNQFKSGRR